MLVLSGCVAIAAARMCLAEPVTGLNAAFATAPGGRSTIETTSELDGRSKIVVRGKYQDARRFLKALFAALTKNDQASSAFDVDLDVKVATLAGFKGEALHDVALRLSAKDAEIREFSLAGKFGSADMRAELQAGGEGKRTIHIETDDAGALLRFMNVYQRVQNGRAVIVIDAPATNAGPRQGSVEIRNFSIVGEPDYKPFSRIMPKGKRDVGNILNLTRLRLRFQLSSDQLLVNDGIATGPLIGATVEGKINFAQDEVALRGILIPLFTSDLIPFGTRLEPADGLFAMSYRITGPLTANRMFIDPVNPLIPGILRKLFAPATDEK